VVAAPGAGAAAQLKELVVVAVPRGLQARVVAPAEAVAADLEAVAVVEEVAEAEAGGADKDRKSVSSEQ
jgi:hypothetical protein